MPFVSAAKVFIIAGDKAVMNALASTVVEVTLELRVDIEASTIALAFKPIPTQVIVMMTDIAYINVVIAFSFGVSFGIGFLNFFLQQHAIDRNRSSVPRIERIEVPIKMIAVF